jgi:serine/threonine protein phosphatase 1
VNRLLRNVFGPRHERKAPSVPDGYRIYAVGDIHGCDALLAELLSRIETEIAARPPASTIIVFLGDLIDRGPDSSAVVERLRTYGLPGVRLIFLAGNHEEVLLRILDGDEELVADWLRFGGAECMQSYGVDPKRLKRLSPARAVAAIRAAIPPAHASFLESFDDTFRAGDYVFVHAGIRPGLPIDEQAQADLRWIREPFLKDLSDHGFVVVHGHTIGERVAELPNRIGIDTGAYKSGVLTAMAAEGPERWFLQTGQSDA